MPPCRPPTAAESAFPFTGRWTDPAGEGWCLFQPDYRTVIGRLESQRAVGVVQSDGELLLSLTHPADGLTMLSGRLIGRDTLHLEFRAANPEPFRRAVGRFVRTAPSGSP